VFQQHVLGHARMLQTQAGPSDVQLGVQQLWAASPGPGTFYVKVGWLFSIPGCQVAVHKVGCKHRRTAVDLCSDMMGPWGLMPNPQGYKWLARQAVSGAVPLPCMLYGMMCFVMHAMLCCAVTCCRLSR
jgi:hypothetical protein